MGRSTTSGQYGGAYTNVEDIRVNKSFKFVFLAGQVTDSSSRIPALVADLRKSWRSGVLEPSVANNVYWLTRTFDSGY